MRFILPFFLGLAACDGSPAPPPLAETTTFAIQSIQINVTVTSNGAAALFDAQISSGSSALLHLGPSDVLSASAADATDRPLVEYTPGKYAVLMPTQAQTVTLSFTRASKVVSTNALALPTPFTIMPPASNMRSKGIAIAWAPGMTGETMAMTVTAPCVPGTRILRTPDPLGTGFILQAADFSTTTGTCILDVDLTRSAKPVPLTNLAGTSTAKLVQSRTLEIATQP